jgi:hypothetical protein
MTMASVMKMSRASSFTQVTTRRFCSPPPPPPAPKKKFSFLRLFGYFCLTGLGVLTYCGYKIFGAVVEAVEEIVEEAKKEEEY